jgi:outer membrane protein assembly factor BamB
MSRSADTLTVWRTVLGLILMVSTSAPLAAAPWPQFRGPNASGVARESLPLPDAIGPGTNEKWVVEIPPGVSSPVIFGDRVFLTGLRGKDTLITFALDTADGSIVWEAEAPIHSLEKTDKRPKGRLATSTCATDGQHVVSFFGSSGLLCYDRDGKQLWYEKMGPFDNSRGGVSSPLLADGTVVLLEDHNQKSFLAAFDIATGESRWRADRSVFNRSHCSPMLWSTDNRDFVIAVGSGLVTAYDLHTGLAEWFVHGTSSVANITPVSGAGHLFVATANPGPQRVGQLSFEQLVERDDRDGSGRLEHDELPTGFLHEAFSLFDMDEDGELSKSEYQAVQKKLSTCQNGMLAIRGDGETFERTETGIAWQAKKGIPRTSGPIFDNGILFMQAKGGMFQTLDAATGKSLKLDRVPMSGQSFSSPALGDGKVYALSDRGECVVVSANAEWELLSSSEFGEPTYPSPAIADGRVYVRTESKLYCFGK